MPGPRSLIAGALGLLCTGCGENRPAIAAEAPAGASARVASAGPVEAWIRPASAGGMSAAYLSFRNTGAEPIVITGVRVEGARAATLHETVEHGDHSSMLGVDSLVVPAGGEIRFAPRGKHVMLHGLNRDVKVGDSLTVKFAVRLATTISMRLPVMDQ